MLKKKQKTIDNDGQTSQSPRQNITGYALTSDLW